MQPIDFREMKEKLAERHDRKINDYDVMSAALYPKVFEEFADFNSKYGPVDKLDTKTFLVGPDIANEINVIPSQIAIFIDSLDMGASIENEDNDTSPISTPRDF